MQGVHWITKFCRKKHGLYEGWNFSFKSFQKFNTEINRAIQRAGRSDLQIEHRILCMHMEVCAESINKITCCWCLLFNTVPVSYRLRVTENHVCTLNTSVGWLNWNWFTRINAYRTAFSADRQVKQITLIICVSVKCGKLRFALLHSTCSLQDEE